MIRNIIERIHKNLGEAEVNPHLEGIHHINLPFKSVRELVQIALTNPDLYWFAMGVGAEDTFVSPSGFKCTGQQVADLLINLPNPFQHQPKQTPFKSMSKEEQAQTPLETFSDDELMDLYELGIDAEDDGLLASIEAEMKNNRPELYKRFYWDAYATGELGECKLNEGIADHFKEWGNKLDKWLRQKMEVEPLSDMLGITIEGAKALSELPLEEYQERAKKLAMIKIAVEAGIPKGRAKQFAEKYYQVGMSIEQVADQMKEMLKRYEPQVASEAISPFEPMGKDEMSKLPPTPPRPEWYEIYKDDKQWGTTSLDSADTYQQALERLKELQLRYPDEKLSIDKWYEDDSGASQQNFAWRPEDEQLAEAVNPFTPMSAEEKSKLPAQMWIYEIWINSSLSQETYSREDALRYAKDYATKHPMHDVSVYEHDDNLPHPHSDSVRIYSSKDMDEATKTSPFKPMSKREQWEIPEEGHEFSVGWVDAGGDTNDIRWFKYKDDAMAYARGEVARGIKGILVTKYEVDEFDDIDPRIDPEDIWAGPDIDEAKNPFTPMSQKEQDTIPFSIDKDEIKRLWGSGQPIRINGQQYTVHKMSYGDFFLEPVGWKGGETDGFAPGTVWMDYDRDEKVYKPIGPVGSSNEAKKNPFVPMSKDEQAVAGKSQKQFTNIIDMQGYLEGIGSILVHRAYSNLWVVEVPEPRDYQGELPVRMSPYFKDPKKLVYWWNQWGNQIMDFYDEGDYDGISDTVANSQPNQVVEATNPFKPMDRRERSDIYKGQITRGASAKADSVAPETWFPRWWGKNDFDSELDGVSYKDLVKIFGEPNDAYNLMKYEFNADDITTVWVGEIDGVGFMIWDYMKDYDRSYKPEQTTDWNITSYDSDALDKLIGYIEAKKAGVEESVTIDELLQGAI